MSVLYDIGTSGDTEDIRIDTWTIRGGENYHAEHERHFFLSVRTIWLPSLQSNYVGKLLNTRRLILLARQLVSSKTREDLLKGIFVI